MANGWRGVTLVGVVAAVVATLFRAPATGRTVPLASALSSHSPTPSSSEASPSPSPTASESPGPTPDPDYRRVSLGASRREVRVGRRVRFFGRVAANRPECRAAVRVVIRRLIFGTSRELTVARRVTEEDGTFDFAEDVRWNSLYTAIVRRERRCPRRESDPVDVYARVWFSFRITDATPERGTNFRIYGRVRPPHPHTPVVLQRRKAGRWIKLQRERLSDRSSFSFFPYAGWQGKRVFRLRWPKSDRDHQSGKTRRIVIRTR